MTQQYWAEFFKLKHGFYPIAGGSGDVAPPGATIQVPVNNDGSQDPNNPPQPPPVAQQGFQTGAQEAGQHGSPAPGQAPDEQPSSQPHHSQAQPRDESGRFSAEDIERVRKEEKDKLYPRLSQMEQELQALREERRKREEEEAQRTAEAEAQRKKAEEAEMNATELINRKEQEWNERFQQLEQERERDRALAEKERQLSTLTSYKQQVLQQHEDDILPELRDYLSGSTKEEIDQSATMLMQRTEQILQNLTASQQQQRQQMPGVRPTAPQVGPLENQESQKTFTANDIANMSLDEYAKYRDKMLGAASAQGPYGVQQ